MVKKFYLVTSLFIISPLTYAEKSRAEEQKTKNTDSFESIWEELDRVHEEFEQLQNHMDEMSRHFWHEDNILKLPSTYSLGVEDKENNLIARITLPGINPESVNLSIEDTVLRISGSHEEHKEEQGEKKGKVVTSKRFNMVRTLPCTVIVEETKAEYEGDVLTITMPKAQTEKTKTIKISKK